MLEPGYGPGVMQGRRSQVEDGRYYNTYGCDGVGEGCSSFLREVALRTLTRLTFTAADGTEYEFRDAQTDGTPHQTTWRPETGDAYEFSRGKVFVTADGTSATFISDEPILDYKLDGRIPLDKAQFTPSGWLLFKDGTRYRVAGGHVTSITNRNGNRMTFSADLVNGAETLTAIDPLSRQVIATYAMTVPGCDVISFRGFGGQGRTVKVCRAMLSTLLRTNRAGDSAATKTYRGLFPDMLGASTQTKFDTAKPSRVELPDGRSYRFRYGVYGDLARVELPTGGAIEYDWLYTSSASEIHKRVVERRLYASASDSSLQNTTTYSPGPEAPGASIRVQVRDAGGALLTQSDHYFHGAPDTDLGPEGPVLFTPWQTGKEYRTDTFDVVAGAAVLRRKTEQTWQQPVAGQAWPLGQTEADASAKSNSPQVTQTLTTLSDTNQVSKQTFAYDRHGNQTDVYDYDFGAGAAGALLRRTHTDYVTTVAYVTADASPAVGAHLRGLPLQTWTSSDAGGATKASLTVYEYDNYAADMRHAALVARAGITGLDSAAYPATFIRRGNVTGVTSYAAAAAAAEPVTSSTQYDVAGNAVKSIDANGHASVVSYGDSFSNPSSGAGAFIANTYAFETSAASPPVPGPVSTGATITLTTSTVYDFWTGVPTSITDANGQTTTYSYRDAANNLDPLDRLRKVVRPGGTNQGGGGQTNYDYGDTAGNLYARTRTALDATRSTDSFQYFDGLGRPFRSMQWENQDGTKPWLTTDTEYEAMGRTNRTSMPYRAAAGAPLFSTDKWTESTYDGMGRVKTVTTRPDNAVVTTTYAGSRVTVTDQAGKVRRSVSDALGRLVRVDEPDASGNLGAVTSPAQPTSYTYDALGNLRKVDQGGQLRFFMYDSLGRLVRVKNPEQGSFTPDTTFAPQTDPVTGNAAWSAGYIYAAAGNLTSRIDARGVRADYTYDALGRNTTVGYLNETGPPTPPVKRTYDGAANGRGRAWHSYSGGDETNGAAALDSVIDSYDAAGRPLVQRQRFRTANGWANFEVRLAYDLAGNVLTQTYPSDRAVAYTYDVMGRLESFIGKLGDSVERSYSAGVDYDELGGVRQEQFGTATPVYHKRRYNERGQLSKVLAGTTAGDDSWNRGAIHNAYSLQPGTTTQSRDDNNGNLRRQTVRVPNDDAVSGLWETALVYDYDSLNRLSHAREERAGARRWVQAYTYDRWGNRTINQAATTDVETGWEVPEPAFTAAATTNRLAPPAGYTMTYDPAGNLTFDNYTGQGSRTYDAENRMTTAQFVSGQAQTALYSYDADGRRVKRNFGAGGEVWQVYGFGGELLAEYAAKAAPSAPLKEYGYRGGELLVTAEASASPRVNVARSTAGATATASSTLDAGRSAAAAINGDRKGLHWGTDPSTGSGWHDATNGVYPDWLEVAFSEAKTIDEVEVFSLQDNYASPQEPTEQMTFNQYGLDDFRVEYWDGAAWVLAPAQAGSSATATDNRKVWWKVRFAPVTTPKVRVVVTNGLSGYGRIVEVEVYQVMSGGAQVSWLISDQLGTPRMVVDQTGSLQGVRRYDYLPFGEEIGPTVGGRTPPGYSQPGGVRQRFTGYERDDETQLDYAQARYYAGPAGRFISPDPAQSSAKPGNPQSWNRYTYCENNPLNCIDPTGLDGVWASQDVNGGTRLRYFESEEEFNAHNRMLATPYCQNTGCAPWARVNGEFFLWADRTATRLGAHGMSSTFSLAGLSDDDWGGLVRSANSAGGFSERDTRIMEAFHGFHQSGEFGRRQLLGDPNIYEMGGGSPLKFIVGTYKNLRETAKGTGLDAHHIGQQAVMRRFVAGYDGETAPAILVPKLGHTEGIPGVGTVSRVTAGFTNARQLLARDVLEMRRVYPDVPNSALRSIINLNKQMYPNAFVKPPR